MKKLISILILNLLFSAKAYADKLRIICDGVNTQNLVINLKNGSLEINDGKINFKLKLISLGGNEIKAAESKYKGFFTSKLDTHTEMNINTTSGLGKIEFYGKYEGGVPSSYNFLSYNNCRFF